MSLGRLTVQSFVGYGQWIMVFGVGGLSLRVIHGYSLSGEFGGLGRGGWVIDPWPGGLYLTSMSDAEKRLERSGFIEVGSNDRPPAIDIRLWKGGAGRDCCFPNAGVL